MVHQSPSGARDLLPLDVAQKRWIEKRLRPVFAQWGYHRIITSTVERLDTLMAGGALETSMVIQLEESEDETRLGLRPELTASIARAAVTRMAEDTYPQRLYYNANVFRRSGESHGSQHEFYQAGVELLGAGGWLADAEIMLLASDCLQSLGITQWKVILGSADLTASLLYPFPDKLREKVRDCIARIDRIGLENLSMSATEKQRALFLFDLRGKPGDVLQQVASLKLDESQQTAVENLKSLIDLLHCSGFTPESLVLDLSLIQSLDYYTGIVFEVVSEVDSGPQILGQGGRYDQLLSLYHPQGETIPSIGFALNIDNLQELLRREGNLPKEIQPSDWLVVPVNLQAYAAAFARAQKLRQRETGDPIVRVEMELRQDLDPQAVREYARRRAIGQIAWVQDNGSIETEVVPT